MYILFTLINTEIYCTCMYIYIYGCLKGDGNFGIVRFPGHKMKVAVSTLKSPHFSFIDS